jgi:hypothetical protein
MCGTIFAASLAPDASREVNSTNPLAHNDGSGEARACPPRPIDGGKTIKVPDTARNRAWLGKINAPNGETGHPVIQPSQATRRQQCVITTHDP